MAKKISTLQAMAIAANPVEKTKQHHISKVVEIFMETKYIPERPYT
jgi:hypothetical protein